MLESSRSYLRRLLANYGEHFCLLLCSVYGGLKGPVSQMITSGQLPYFKSIGITGQRYQSYGTVASTPWAMKAAIGITSDALPIFGWHKRPYMLICSVMGTVALAVLASVQMSKATAPFAALLLMFVSLQLAVVDLLTEGTYAALMATMPETGADVVTFVWALYMFGSFFGAAVAGPVADHLNPRVIFWICLPLALQVIPLSSYLPERRLPEGQRGLRTDKLREHPKIFMLGLCMTIGAVTLAFVALFETSSAQSIVSVGLSIGLCILASMWLPPLLARGNLYMFLASALYINVGGASDYWFTAGPKCVPGGPHFSFSYYLTIASVAGSLAGMGGVALFQMFLSRGTYRMAFCSTLILKLIASLFDLFIINRENIRLGIPDKVAFILGDAIIYQVASMMDFMPAVVLTSASCPKGMEATVYALLAGFQNFGSNVAREIGVGLLNYLQIQTNEPCNFDRFPLAVVLAHIVIPSTCIPLIFVLIPDKLMTEKLLAEDDTEIQDTESQLSIVTQNETDDEASGDGEIQDTERKELVPRRTEPMDMELDSMYGESEDVSSVSTSFPTGDSLSMSLVSPLRTEDDGRVDGYVRPNDSVDLEDVPQNDSTELDDKGSFDDNKPNNSRR